MENLGHSLDIGKQIKKDTSSENIVLSQTETRTEKEPIAIQIQPAKEVPPVIQDYVIQKSEETFPIKIEPLKERLEKEEKEQKNVSIIEKKDDASEHDVKKDDTEED